ncbi:serrate RNA effector molecule [Iris pallida]|uniref:Serrate RNA effector molecule n=1 Tax=Iris pallida TaxID=29817 RepID=A0AAX6EZ31_IRIPA|nr:serrate RNA effector molecule [Iris pallida]
MAEDMDIPPESESHPREKSVEGSPPLPPPPPRRRDRDSRDYSIQDSRTRSPSLPPPPPRSDRDREYRRRSSPSPPPYRDRRHSPPRRSPPPGGYKRSRRDDGGYDRRRGSPRGGYGYDHGGGYGRGGYDNERSHGRYRLSDWHDSGHGYGDGANSRATQREGLMSYKQFIQELEDDILPGEAERRYEEYRSEYISTQKRAYFEAHKEEEWLKDRYHPTNLVAVIERRNEQARVAAKEFLLDLQSGTLDLGPSLTASTLSKSVHDSAPNSDEEAEAGGKRKRHGRGPERESDLLSSAPKAHPISSESRRIQLDIGQAQALVRKLDTEKGIKDNVLGSRDHEKLDGEKSHGGSIGPIVIIRGLNTVKGLEGAELLDTLLTYLWRIHHVDYYGMSERNDVKGLRHVRTDSSSNDGPNSNGADWEKKLDSFWQERLHGQDTLEIMTAKEKIDTAAVEALDPLVRKIRDEKYGWKYGCGAKGCTKLFHASEFVHKHLKLKHPDLVVDLTSRVREDLYFQNYMNDANAPGGTPVMQQPAPDKALRRRPVSDRLRDDRGNRREYDRNDNDSDRYDRSDNSPSRDTNSRMEGASDEPVHDAYGGEGLCGAPPFSSDMPPPPPVLMPVPGAGPLGPFVPAPPEVAMRMLREQGGTVPFESNGSGRGRKGRPSPHLGGPSPILAASSALRHDPRRIRSYQDLDAPDDEVTVIDYRSLN